MTRRSPWGAIRFLAVALLLAGMAYVTWDTQQDVRLANDERRVLRGEVHDLQAEVQSLKAANARKDAEIARLNALLTSRGIDPRPTRTPSPAGTKPSKSSQRPTSTATPAPPRATTSPTPAPTSSPRPTPTCTTVYDPLTGRCVL